VRSLFKYSYKSEAEINVPKKAVWRVLTDCETYPKWNPFTVRIDTDWQIGHKIHLHVKFRPSTAPSVQTEYISVFRPEDELGWRLDWSLLLKAERTQRLTDIGKDKTHYFNEDVIEGPLSPLVHLIYGKMIQKGFESVAASLKKYMEKG
jgi:uncharacterized protein YndB with AHSA1/START domain